MGVAAFSERFPLLGLSPLPQLVGGPGPLRVSYEKGTEQFEQFGFSAWIVFLAKGFFCNLVQSYQQGAVSCS